MKSTVETLITILLAIVVVLPQEGRTRFDAPFLEVHIIETSIIIVDKNQSVKIDWAVMEMPERPQAIAQLILELGHSLMAHFETQFVVLNLTFPQAMLLRQLDDALPMSAAAGKLGCDPSNITGIVDRLEGRGLIARQQLPGDRRVKHLVLTEDGRRLKCRIDAILSDVPGLSDLPAADQAVLHELLTRSLGHASSNQAS